MFEAPGPGSTSGSSDVSADGQRFLTIEPAEKDDSEPPKLRIVLNWLEEFREREQD